LQELGKFNERYRKLFSAAGGEGGDEAEEGGFLDTWGWFINLDQMSNGRIELWDYLTDMNVTAFMNYMAYRHDKANYERVVSSKV